MQNKKMCDIIKTMKYLLKNAEKYMNSHLCRGIYLNNLKTEPRVQEEKKSKSVKMGNVWFIVNGKKCLFKTYDGKYKKELKNLRIINELICCELCNQINLSHATYLPAHHSKKQGLITPNFLSDNQKIITLAKLLEIDNTLENNLVDINSALKLYEKCGIKINTKQIIFDLYKILVFDALTLQTDRNNYNINFIYDKTQNTIFGAPLFDNEFAFNIDNIFDDELPPSSFNSLLKNYSQSSKFATVLSERLVNTKTYFNNIKALCNLAKANPEYYKFLTSALKKLNITKAIIFVEKMGIEISPEYKQYLKGIISGTKRMFTIELSKPTYAEDLQFLNDELLKN